eukprot:PhM_4_TR18616/c0_g3_i1/m.83744
MCECVASFALCQELDGTAYFNQFPLHPLIAREWCLRIGKERFTWNRMPMGWSHAVFVAHTVTLFLSSVDVPETRVLVYNVYIPNGVTSEDVQAKVSHEAFLKESVLELSEQLKDDFDASVARWGRDLNDLREVNATLRISLERARQEALDLSHREGNASIDVAMRETVADGLMESLHSVRKELHALGETMAETQKERDAAVNRCGTLE